MRLMGHLRRMSPESPKRHLIGLIGPMSRIYPIRPSAQTRYARTLFLRVERVFFRARWQMIEAPAGGSILDCTRTRL
jgi:hypothetical protein